MGFLEVMEERGLIAQVTNPDELREELATPTIAYMGFDPTADSLHVGGLMCAMTLRRWQQSGHKVVVLMGGGTGFVGDPSGKTELRKMLDTDTISNNISKLTDQIKRFVDLDAPEKGIVVNNADWLMSLEYLPFLRDIGRHFSVNRMLTAECFKQRLEKGLTFLEFNYMLLQSYDFLELHKTEGVSIQLGGDDQWSNMLGGMDLVRRVCQNKAYCLTWPLLTTSDGKKMGKTEKGAVWLDAEKTSPFDFFQFWRNVSDQDVKKCLNFMTEIPVGEIDSLCQGEGAAINEAKVRLAYEVTALVHGENTANEVRETVASLYKSGAGTGNEPEVWLTESEFGSGLSVLDFLTLSKVVPSKAEARRLIQQGGLALNGKKVHDIKYVVSSDDVSKEDGCLVKRGKKHYYRIRIR